MSTATPTGVEPICAVWPIAPSTYYTHKAQAADPERRCARARRDDGRRPRIRQVWEENFAVYGVRKGWRELRASKPLRSELALDALDQALYDRPIAESARLIHHSDRGGQGEFNRSSQHPTGRGCDDYTETAVRSGRTSETVLAWPTRGWAA